MFVDKYIAIVEKQEEMLQFPRFTRRDAWDLGNIIVNEAFEKNLALAVSIRQPSGLILFQYAPEKTTLDNEKWMSRKYNTVRDMEVSSLLFGLRLSKRKQTLQERKLDPTHYVAGGGGFPIRIKDFGLAAVIAVSGLPGMQDHDTIITGISRFLKVDGVPRVPLNAKI